jgi:hypothetical protein
MRPGDLYRVYTPSSLTHFVGTLSPEMKGELNRALAVALGLDAPS